MRDSHSHGGDHNRIPSIQFANTLMTRNALAFTHKDQIEEAHPTELEAQVTGGLHPQLAEAINNREFLLFDLSISLEDHAICHAGIIVHHYELAYDFWLSFTSQARASRAKIVYAVGYTGSPDDLTVAVKMVVANA